MGWETGNEQQADGRTEPHHIGFCQQASKTASNRYEYTHMDGMDGARNNTRNQDMEFPAHFARRAQARHNPQHTRRTLLDRCERNKVGFSLCAAQQMPHVSVHHPVHCTYCACLACRQLTVHTDVADLSHLAPNPTHRPFVHMSGLRMVSDGRWQPWPQ